MMHGKRWSSRIQLNCTNGDDRWRRTIFATSNKQHRKAELLDTPGKDFSSSNWHEIEICLACHEVHFRLSNATWILINSGLSNIFSPTFISTTRQLDNLTLIPHLRGVQKLRRYTAIMSTASEPTESPKSESYFDRLPNEFKQQVIVNLISTVDGEEKDTC